MSIAEVGLGVASARMPGVARAHNAGHGVPRLTIAAPSRPALSSREVEVMLAWMAAESKEDAANHLFISQSTVSTHISRIRAKYTAVGRCAPTKAHLLARALQDGYTTLDEW